MKFASLIFLSITLLSANCSAKFDFRKDLIFGVETGGIIKHSTSTIEEDGQGVELGLKVLTTRPWRGWDIDFGGGWRINQLTEEEVSVRTTTFFIETALRESFGPRFSAGPMLSALIGRDVSFSDFGTNSDNKTMSLFVGAKALYEVPFNKVDGRVGMQLQTDLNIGSRQITQIQAVVEFDWPFGHGNTVAQNEEVQVDELERSPAKVEEKVVTFKKPDTFNLSAAGLNFGLDSARLSMSSRQMIDQVAALLRQHRGDWKTVGVYGHSDRQGNYRHNLKLSKKRAVSVKEVFRRAGLNKREVSARGFGSLQPLDPTHDEIAHARNRRVELKIYGLTKGSELSQQLERLLN